MNTINDLKKKVFESLGTASMCWSERPRGIFDDQLASKVAKELCDEIHKQMVPRYTGLHLMKDYFNYIKWSLIGFVKFAPLYFTTASAIWFFLLFIYPLTYTQCFAIFALLRIARIVISKPKEAKPNE